MLTLDEAIKHYEEKAEEQRRWATSLENGSVERVDCLECAKEHEQLAEWLKELKRYEEMEAISSISIIPSACRNCSNHPSNGGSGICHCILGSSITY